MASKFYVNALAQAFNKEIDWDTDTIKIMLLSSSHTPNQDAHNYLDDVVANEVTGTGYTAGGITLTGKTVTVDGATNTVKLDADDVEWTASTITARYAVIYDATPATNATKPLLGYSDIGERSSTNGVFSIQFGADGVFTLTAA